MGSRNGISTEKIEALHDYAKSPLFTDAEKVALEYADAITDTHRDVDDELFARVQQQPLVRWFNRALGYQPAKARR